MIVKIRKMIKPTTGLLPATKLPKASITWPAYPCSKIDRVEETLSANRKRVVMRRTVGKTENSSVFRTFIVNIKIKKERAMLTEKKRSRMKVGRGINNMARMITIKKTTTISPLKASLDNRALSSG
jgi:hypothetical protein